mmetsp:Transcript_17198/g.38898  ORF Transcript_17198/g.38898 Transcript_17198/m.38898 type:complete len:211 (-) Transcript_17198:76-708(-)
MVDPTTALRLRQLVEYQKICTELRLPSNSAVVKSLEPPSEDKQLLENVDSRPGSRCSDEPPRPHEYTFVGFYLGDRQFRALAAALAIDRNLMSLRVPDTGMMDPGMVGLCEQLKRSSFLEHLEVSKNRFSRRGAEACLSLASCAPRLILVETEDTCLDQRFIEKRGLSCDFSGIRHKMNELFKVRLDEQAKEAELSSLRHMRRGEICITR